MQNVKRHNDMLDLSAQNHRYALVAARFNLEITQKLLDGALEGLVEHGAGEEQITVAWVPGAFELPLVAKKMAQSRRFDAVICLGAVVRGETAHFDYVAGEAAAGILHASLDTSVPVIFSVLTTHTWQQAIDRAGKKESNNGYNGAISAIEMVNLLKKLEL